jgi:hypothetical protein
MSKELEDCLACGQLTSTESMEVWYELAEKMEALRKMFIPDDTVVPDLWERKLVSGVKELLEAWEALG